MRKCEQSCCCCPHAELIETGYGTFYACEFGYDDCEEYEECCEDD